MEGVWLGLGAGNWMYVLFDVAARGPIDSTRQKKPEGRTRAFRFLLRVRP